MKAMIAASARIENDDLLFNLWTVSGDALKDHPDYAIGIFIACVYERLDALLFANDQTDAYQELERTIYEWALYDDLTTWSDSLRYALFRTSLPIGELPSKKRGRGRPTKSRRTAIKALLYKEYFHKSWALATLTLCPCGRKHYGLQLDKCKENIESEARKLKAVLKEYGVEYPPVVYDTSNNKRCVLPRNTVGYFDEDSQTLKKRNIQTGLLSAHPSIRLIFMNRSVTSSVYRSTAHLPDIHSLLRFDGSVKGWIPIWFPELRTAIPIRSRTEYEELRYKWFDRAFRLCAGDTYPPRDTIEKQIRATIDALLRVYDMAHDDHTLDLDNLVS